MRAARGEFDRQLEGIEAKVIELFGIVVEDLPEAAGAFVGDGGGSGRVLAAREQVIDALYLEVEDLACKMMLLQAPVGPDLRFLLTVLRVVPELERSHDLVMQIAGRGALIRGADLSPHSRGLAGRMGEVAADMWRQAADAWYRRDRSAAPALGLLDEEMGQLCAGLRAELGAGETALPVAMDMTLVANDYRRLGAHAANIARRVAYLAGPVAG
jgi:phosphate transport system protein